MTQKLMKRTRRKKMTKRNGFEGCHCQVYDEEKCCQSILSFSLHTFVSIFQMFH